MPTKLSRYTVTYLQKLTTKLILLVIPSLLSDSAVNHKQQHGNVRSNHAYIKLVHLHTSCKVQQNI